MKVRAPVELTWAILPTVALFLVFAGTWKAMQRVSDAGDIPAAPQNHTPSLAGAGSSLALQTPTPASSRTERSIARQPERKKVEPAPREVVSPTLQADAPVVGLQEYQQQEPRQ